MAMTRLASALGDLGVGFFELAQLIEEDVATVHAWAEGFRPAPRWLQVLADTWRQHPELLAVARDNAAVRLTEFAIDDDVMFEAVA